MRRLGDYVDTVHQRLAPFKHWFLQTVGVSPQFQGKGYAGKLLRPMLSKIDEEDLPCYLETPAQGVTTSASPPVMVTPKEPRYFSMKFTSWVKAYHYLASFVP